jgi:exonuclease III
MVANIGSAPGGNGFRIDHAFLSQDLAAHAGTIRYSHEERIAGLSDHSPLNFWSWQSDPTS